MIGPCAGPRLCDRDGVVYVYRTVGPSARVTVVTGPRAAQLGTGTPEGFLGVRCLDCALVEVETVIEGATP